MNIKTIIVFMVALLPWVNSANGTQVSPDKNLHIYILMGQSNMAGRGAVTGIYSKQSHPRVLVFDKSRKFIEAKHPLHFDKPKATGVGPGLSFGISMANSNDESVKIGLVPCAVGGTSIDKWVPGAYDKVTDTHPYDDAIARIKEAMKLGVIKGVIWHQGEGDSSPGKAKVYLPKLKALVERVRAEVNDPDLPFVIGELARYRDVYHNINEQLVEVPLQINNLLVVSSEGLWHKGDGTHFDSPSATEFGFRFAAGMLQLQGKSNPVTYPKGKHNVLSKKELAEGWELLFDGSNPGKRWRSINGFAFPKEGWTVENEMLVLLPGQKGKDIITREQFSDFELVLEFKLTDSANTGIKYFVAGTKDQKGKVKLNGPEFQLIDDYKHAAVRNNKDPKASTASLYLLYEPVNKRLKKAGRWNEVKIISKGSTVEHWLNGKKVLSYVRGSEDFKNRVANTKFNELINYGEAEFGHILLQDHRDRAYFRNLKIRRLKN